MPDLLLVEDNLFIQQLIRKSVLVRSLRIRVAVNQFEAKIMFEECMPDLLISDLHMPTGTTQEFLKQVYLTGFSKVLILSSDFEMLEEMKKKCPNPRWEFVSKNGQIWLGEVRRFLRQSIALSEL